MSTRIEEIEEKILKIADEYGVNRENVKKKLDLLKKLKRKIRGVWASPNWLWIATEQDTKFTWYGVTFSPFVPEGEFGSWYVGELEEMGIKPVIKPTYRWKLTPSDWEKLRRMKKLLMGEVI